MASSLYNARRSVAFLHNDSGLLEMPNVHNGTDMKSKIWLTLASSALCLINQIAKTYHMLNFVLMCITKWHL